MWNKASFVGLVGLFVWVSGSPLFAQTAEEKPKPQKKATPANGLNLQPTVAQSMATVERMVEVAVQGVAARYNLNEAQRAATEEIMKRDVQKFLKDHEAEVWPLIRDLLKYQLGGNPPTDPEEIKRLGKNCRPFVKLAEEAIIKGNMEWRDKVLTEAQKKTHDFDMEHMKGTFKQIESNFSEWEQGRVTGKSLFPKQDPRQGPPTPPRPPTESLPDPVTERVVSVDTIFDTIVENFIKDYSLDEGQVVSARSILREYKDKAADFKNSNKEELARLTKDMNDAREQRNERKRVESETEFRKLTQPVSEMVVGIEVRLRGLLTSVQMEKYNANNRDLDPNARSTERKAASDAARKEERKPEKAPAPDAPKDAPPAEGAATKPADKQPQAAAPAPAPAAPEAKKSDEKPAEPKP